ncbi:MAG: MFS transporter [Pseudomonadota bacterium]
MSSGGKKWLVFLVVSLGVFLSTLDSSMVNIALPAIMAEFGSPLHKTEWVVMSYLLTTSTTLLVWGHFSDRLGRNRFYGVGFLVFGIGSLFCAFAQTLNMLIAARFFQALGAAMLMANGPALIRQAFPPEKLGRSMGFVGIPVSLGLMSGPVVGGYLIEFFSWRALFLLSLPVCLLFAPLSQFVLPANPSANTSSREFDWSGAILWALLLGAVSFSLTHAVQKGVSWWMTAFLVTVSLLAGIFFIKVETEAVDPVLPLALLKKPFFFIGVMSALLSFLLLFAVLILIPFYLDRVLGLSPSRIGLVMLTIPLTVLLVAPLAGWLSDSLGAKILSTLGLACSCLGLLLLAFLSPQSSSWGVAIRLMFLGIGQAMFLSPNSASVLGRLDDKKSGTAAALLATARNLGMMLGVALAGLAFSFFFRLSSGGYDMLHYEEHMANNFCQALQGTFLLFLIAGLYSVYLSWQRPFFVTKTGGIRR